MNSNLHMYILMAPLLTAFFLGIIGRKSRTLLAPCVLGSLALSTILSIVVLRNVLEVGPISYTVGAWLPPWGFTSGRTYFGMCSGDCFPDGLLKERRICPSSMNLKSQT